MTISIQISEDSGPIDVDRGTNRSSINNIGYKDSGEAENQVEYPYAPIRRPGAGLNYSYPKYNFGKWSGTYTKASRPRFEITNNLTAQIYYDQLGTVIEGYTCTANVKLFYKLTNVYNPGDPEIDGEMIFLAPGDTVTIYPRTSTTGPQDATSYRQWYNTDTTYYTEYLVTKIYAMPGDFGNLCDLQIKFLLDEYEENIL